MLSAQKSGFPLPRLCPEIFDLIAATAFEKLRIMNLSHFQRPSVFLVTLLVCILVSGCDSSTPGQTKGEGLRLVSSGGDKHFKKVGINKWTYTNDTSSERKLWAAVFDAGKTKGQKFTGSMKVTSDKPVKLSAVLARDGDTAYEGTGAAVVLKPNVSQSVSLSHQFVNDYPRIKLQFDVAECSDPTVTFTVDDVMIRPAK